MHGSVNLLWVLTSTGSLCDLFSSSWSVTARVWLPGQDILLALILFMPVSVQLLWGGMPLSVLQVPNFILNRLVKKGPNVKLPAEEMLQIEQSQKWSCSDLTIAPTSHQFVQIKSSWTGTTQKVSVGFEQAIALHPHTYTYTNTQYINFPVHSHSFNYNTCCFIVNCNLLQ